MIIYDLIRISLDILRQRENCASGDSDQVVNAHDHGSQVSYEIDPMQVLRLAESAQF